jgi:SAM-dependent methyltransferase
MNGVVRKSYATHFASRRVAENYRFRPSYSPEVIDTLLSLLVEPRAVLDAGCGPGKLTLALANKVARIHAVDPSEEMLKLARAEQGGTDPKITWTVARIEEAAFEPPYGLIVAGAAIHWMDLDVALPRFADALTPDGVLALVDGDAPIGAPWEAEENALFSDFIERLQGAPPKFPPTRLQQLERPFIAHPLFERLGSKITAPWPVTQTVEDHLRCQHSRATWSEDHMGAAMAGEFDMRMRALFAPHAPSGVLSYAVRSRLEWGKPLKAPTNPAP